MQRMVPAKTPCGGTFPVVLLKFQNVTCSISQGIGSGSSLGIVKANFTSLCQHFKSSTTSALLFSNAPVISGCKLQYCFMLGALSLLAYLHSYSSSLLLRLIVNRSERWLAHSLKFIDSVKWSAHSVYLLNMSQQIKRVKQLRHLLPFQKHVQSNKYPGITNPKLSFNLYQVAALTSASYHSCKQSRLKFVRFPRQTKKNSTCTSWERDAAIQ